MGIGFKHGGGYNPLNFKVVGGTTRPSNPIGNILWANTSVSISTWVIHDLSSFPTEGIQEGAIAIRAYFGDSDRLINALKKNFMLFTLTYVEQFVSGSWVKVNAEIYLNGNWVEVNPNRYLYYMGNEYTVLTGGWVSAAKLPKSDANSDALTPVVERGDTSIRASITSNKKCGIFYVQNPIDITGYSTLVLEGTFHNSSSFGDNVSLHLWSSLGTYYDSNIVASARVPSGTCTVLRLDVSSLADASYYIGFSINTYGGSSSYVEVTKAYLEK